MQLSILKKYLKALDRLEQESESNAYLKNTLNRDLALEKIILDGPLSGYICAIKDLVSNTDHCVTGGSQFLLCYRPPFNSSVYRAIEEAGALNLAQANLDEFGMGGTGLSSTCGVVPNAIDKERIIGGSSSGSAYLISKGIINFSIASDTGDSARYPAALVGVVGFKPSYGAISRYGFYPFCSSFDTPSICADNVETVAKVFSVISFPDEHDLCTLKTVQKDYTKNLKKPIEHKLRIAVLDDTFWSAKPVNTSTHKEVIEKFEELVNLLKDQGHTVETYSFRNKNLFRLSELIYAVVAYSESISNYANLTGVLFPYEKKEGEVKSLNLDKYKNYVDTMKYSRSVFGKEFTVRQLLGKHFLEGENYEQVYLKCKRLLGEFNAPDADVAKLFEKYDLVISPTNFDIPGKIVDWRREYSPRGDLCIRLLANFCSLPAISIPWVKVQNMPIGLHIMSRNKSEEFLLRASYYFSQLFEEKK